MKEGGDKYERIKANRANKSGVDTTFDVSFEHPENIYDKYLPAVNKSISIRGRLLFSSLSARAYASERASATEVSISFKFQR